MLRYNIKWMTSDECRRKVGPDHLLRRSLRDHHPRHLGIKSTNAVPANGKVGRIEDMRLDEIKHRAIDPRPFGLH
jgi:hypothetical protein